MLQTKIGPYNGRSWEDLCQLVFKRKYENVGYQQMPASPGDYGLEGFTLRSGIGFQCYCPDAHYSPSDLYVKQRDKITEDLGKLKKYETEIVKRIGNVKIKEWHFVTPEFDQNALLAHERNKEADVKAWGLSIIDPDFTIHIRDAEYYLPEINQVRSLNGQALHFDISAPVLPVLTGPQDEYESNLKRKTDCRLSPKKHSPKITELTNKLYDLTRTEFLEHDGLLRRIEQSAPTLYFRLVRLINEYEKCVAALGTTWTGTAEELVQQVQNGLSEMIVKDLGPEIDQTRASEISRHLIARWLAVCELDFD